MKTLSTLGAVATLVTTAGHAEVKTGYAAANGLDYYYEISGEGEPMLLLHGGLGSTDIFKPIMAALTEHRQVIALDLQGHGRTELRDRRLDIFAMGDDMATVLRSLGYDKVDVLGYSFGGGVGFRFAVQHPEMVRRLAIVSAGYSEEGFYPDIRGQQVQMTAAAAEFMKDTPMYKSYMAVAPKPEDFPRLLQGIGDLMREHYDWSEDVKKLAMPTMIVFGDSDMYSPEHIVKFYQLLGGGLKDAGWMRENISQNRLAIIPNATHYDIFYSPALPATVLGFLDGTDKPKSWSEVVEGK
jgi:pimeloyl-ACP methyl ester carboxylesterase